jgi:MoaA/NifB/PqqE/SkfB family radical SAM enzyme
VSIAGHDSREFAGILREFIFKVDGHRPILYPLEYTNPTIHYLSPQQGLALSLLNGRRTLSQARQVFAAIAPGARADAFDQLVASADDAVRRNPSTNGFGRNGVLEWSREPLEHAPDYDPRDFVVNPDEHRAAFDHPQTRLRLRTPINVYTVFTHRCFTSCAYCYAQRPRTQELPLTRWREIIAEMRSLGIHLASPDNGDTFARRDGVELLECLLEHGMHFLLSTKAFVSREVVARLVDAGLTRPVRGVVERKVQLSLDAVEPDVARSILGVRADRTRRMVDTLDNFLSFGIMPKVKGVITGLNHTQPLRIVEELYPRGARVFNFVRYRRTFHRHTDSLFVQPGHETDLRRQFDTILERYPDVDLQQEFFPDTAPDPGTAPPTKRELWANRLGCGGGWNSLGISTDGKAFLCEQVPMEDPFIVGDASTASIAEIWDGKPLRDFIFPTREQFDGTACQACPDFEECMWATGRCYRDAFFNYGTVYDQPPACPRNQREALRLG